MGNHPLCRECGGTGWIPYRSETVDGELEEAYRLCPKCTAPHRCMGSKASHPCTRPGVLRYRLGYYCKEHIVLIHHCGDVDKSYDAICYLRRWLQIARDRENEFLEVQISKA